MARLLNLEMGCALNLTQITKMKKSLLLLILSFCFANSQAQSTVENPHYISIGVGAPNMAVSFFNIYDTKMNFKVEGKGPYHFKYEYRLNNFLGFGMNVNNASYKVTYTEDFFDTSLGKFMPNNITISNNNTAFNLRGNLHFINPEKNEFIDVYWGFGLGLKFGGLKVSSSYQGANPSIKLPNISKIGLESTLGIRYSPIKNISIYSEIGLAKSIFQGGITFRL